MRQVERVCGRDIRKATFVAHAGPAKGHVARLRGKRALAPVVNAGAGRQRRAEKRVVALERGGHGLSHYGVADGEHLVLERPHRDRAGRGRPEEQLGQGLARANRGGCCIMPFHGVPFFLQSWSIKE